MGRLTGIPHFLGDSALQDEKSDASDLRKAKKELEETKERKKAMDIVKKEIEEASEKEKAKEIEEALSNPKGVEKLTTVEEPIVVDDARTAVPLLEVDGEIKQDPLKLRQILIARRMQVQFAGRLLRRTIDSLDNDGKPLLKLPGCKKVYCPLRLTDRELEIITVLAESVKDRYWPIIRLSVSFC